jgi:hypothetical protein
VRAIQGVSDLFGACLQLLQAREAIGTEQDESVKKSGLSPVNCRKIRSAAGDLQSTRVADSVKHNILQRNFPVQFSLHSMESVG